MNLFQMKSKPHGIERMAEFLKDNFVCIGWPGIGDLGHVDKEELEDRLAQVYKYQGQELANQLEAVSAFVHTMQDGDYVLVADNDCVHLGDVGDYYYIEEFDTQEDGTCHRHGVTWLTSIPRSELNAEVQELLRQSGTITKFEHPFSMAQLERWSSNHEGIAPMTGKTSNVDPQTIEEALQILKKALRSEDADRRERAAVAILQFARNN
jgi:predicted Mrr-cat superfamily restriction endonuclease